MFKNIRTSWFVANVGARLKVRYNVDRADWALMVKDRRLWNTLSYAKDAGFSIDETADMVVAGFVQMIRRANEQEWG